jgi:glycogen synthase
MSPLRRVALFTNEYPPHVYGGAGVHVEYLSRELARLLPVEVRCFGEQDVRETNLRVRGYGPWTDAREDTDPRFGGALDAFHRSLAMARDRLDADVVHCHTWYTDMAGFLAKKLWDVPLVLTTHSLEPLRPWKVEQLGNAYRLSAWMERTSIEDADAVVAVSKETRIDVLRHFAIAPEKVHVIHNGIDLGEYRPDRRVDALVAHGVDPDRPYVLFVGRITRQKGIIHLVNAIKHINPEAQIVLCAGAPDTNEIAAEMEAAVAEVKNTRDNVIWIQEMLSKPDVIQMYTHAAVFCCPSIYEPFGIINLEAMACKTAVVASAVGGIKEVVVDGETGILVPVKQLNVAPFEPEDPEKFSQDLAAGINKLLDDPVLREAMAEKGQARARDVFSWASIAEQTKALYESLTAGE